MTRLAERVRRASPSMTLVISAKAKEMKRRGVDVISLAVGEPDFDTPAHIKEAAIRAIEEGFTGYTPAAGIPELREAVAAKFRHDNGLEYDPQDVLITVGAKQAVYNALQALCDDGDEVIVPAPYWVSYTEMVKLAGGTPVVVSAGAERGFVPDLAQLEDALSERTRAIILNTPNNPSGAVYSRQQLEAIASLAVRHDLFVIADEVYEKLVYGEAEHVSIASLGEEIKARTVTVNGVSKAYAMTGWRIGYAAGPREVIAAMAKLQGQQTSNATSIAQKASLAALTGPQDPVEEMVREYEGRRDLVVERLSSMPGVRCIKPDGAFYVFADFSEFYGRSCAGRRVEASLSLAELLLEEARVALVPGVAFGMDDYIRLSYAASRAELQEGLDRIESLLGKLV